MTSEPEQSRAELVAALAQIAGGDRPALQRLYHRTSAKLFGVCTRILSDEAEAEDVLQEVYVIVWKKADQFDASRGVSPITWLVAIARNRALDRLRSRKSRWTGLDEAAEIADGAPLADAALETGEASARLAACLRGLEARAADAIRAAFFGGVTYERLSTQAGMPLGSMKSLIRRGLMRLKLCLETP
jgi:RNA polymerase sigma factor (sigma-70 family)